MTPDGLSVVTATRNRPEVLLDKAHALAAQTLPRDRFEWIVAFDGPAPALEERLTHEVGDAVRLRTVATPGGGPGPARDAAAAEARHDVLYLSDDDCLPDPRTLARHLEAQARPAVYLGEVVFAEPDGGESRRRWRRPGWWNVNGANVSFPREAFEAVGGFGSDLVGYGGEDLWLGWRLHRAGLSIRALAGAPVLHDGAMPESTASPERARQAGANAVRLARREPRVAWRLGVHPWMLRAKCVVLPYLAPIAGPGVRGDLDYTRGAWRAWRGDEDAP